MDNSPVKRCLTTTLYSQVLILSSLQAINDLIRNLVGDVKITYKTPNDELARSRTGVVAVMRHTEGFLPCDHDCHMILFTALCCAAATFTGRKIALPTEAVSGQEQGPTIEAKKAKASTGVKNKDLNCTEIKRTHATTREWRHSDKRNATSPPGLTPEAKEAKSSNETASAMTETMTATGRAATGMTPKGPNMETLRKHSGGEMKILCKYAGFYHRLINLGFNVTIPCNKPQDLRFLGMLFCYLRVCICNCNFAAILAKTCWNLSLFLRFERSCCEIGKIRSGTAKIWCKSARKWQNLMNFTPTLGQFCCVLVPGAILPLATFATLGQFPLLANNFNLVTPVRFHLCYFMLSLGANLTNLAYVNSTNQQWRHP